MKLSNTTFFIFLSSIVAVTVAITFVLKQICPQFITSLWLFQILFFAVVNVVMFFLTSRIKKKNDINKLTYFFMIGTVVKLFLYLVVLAIYVIKFPEDRMAFVISFLVYYICFTFFETFIKLKINK